MSIAPPIISLDEQEIYDLTRAKLLLENPGLTARLASVVGTPLERGFAMLPGNWSTVVQRAVRLALWRALEVAVTTVGRRPGRRSSNAFHKLLVGASGGVGGAFGLPAMVIELPISTTIMLRSIAEIAREEGHDVREIQTKLNCLQVFALGGRSAGDDAADSAYWAVRAALSRTVAEA